MTYACLGKFLLLKCLFHRGLDQRERERDKYSEIIHHSLLRKCLRSSNALLSNTIKNGSWRWRRKFYFYVQLFSLFVKLIFQLSTAKGRKVRWVFSEALFCGCVIEWILFCREMFNCHTLKDFDEHFWKNLNLTHSSQPWCCRKGPSCCRQLFIL